MVAEKDEYKAADIRDAPESGIKAADEHKELTLASSNKRATSPPDNQNMDQVNGSPEDTPIPAIPDQRAVPAPHITRTLK